MYLYFTTGNGQASQGNQHCANCIGALSFRMNKMPAWQHVDEIKKTRVGPSWFFITRGPRLSGLATHDIADKYGN